MSIRKKIQEISNRRTTLRIHISVVGILALVIILIGASYYRQSRNALLNECSALIQETMLQINASIDLTVDNVLDISKQVYNDKALYPMLESEYPQRFDSYNYLSKKLDQIKNSSRYVDSLAFYMEKSGMFLYQDYGVAPKEILGDENFLQWYYGSGPDIAVADTHPFTYREPEKHVFSVYARLPIGENINPNGALIINIDQSSIYNGIIRLADPELVFLIADQNSRVIFSRDTDLLYRPTTDLSYLREVEPGRNRIVEIGGSPCLVVAQRSNARNWTYFMAYPIHQVYGTITNIRLMVITVSILVLLIGSFVAFRLLSSALHQYDEVFSIIKSKAISYQVATGNVKDDVLTLFSERERIQEQWDMVSPLFQEKFYLSLIVQRNDAVTIREQSGRLNLALPEEALILSVLELDGGSPGGQEYLESLSATGVVESVMASADCWYFCVETSYRRIVLVAGADMEPLLLRLEEIIRKINGRLHVNIAVSVCDGPCAPEGLHQAYQMALQASRNKIVFGYNRIILHSDTKNDTRETYLYPDHLDENLRTLIKAGKEETAIRLLADMFRDLSGRRSYFAMQQFIFRLNASMMELMEELSFEKTQDVKQANLQNFDSPDEVFAYFETIVRSVAERAKKTSDSRMDEYFRKISTFIQQNHTRNPSIEQLCSHVKLSPTYVNQILRKYTGLSFVQYMNDYRIEQSCALLRGTEITVKDISEQLGFNSSKYFIKLFKDFKGLTPGEYRKQL